MLLLVNVYVVVLMCFPERKLICDLNGFGSFRLASYKGVSQCSYGLSPLNPDFAVDLSFEKPLDIFGDEADRLPLFSGYGSDGWEFAGIGFQYMNHYHPQGSYLSVFYLTISIHHLYLIPLDLLCGFLIYRGYRKRKRVLALIEAQEKTSPT